MYGVTLTVWPLHVYSNIVSSWCMNLHFIVFRCRKLVISTVFMLTNIHKCCQLKQSTHAYILTVTILPILLLCILAMCTVLPQSMVLWQWWSHDSTLSEGYLDRSESHSRQPTQLTLHACIAVSLQWAKSVCQWSYKLRRSAFLYAISYSNVVSS